MYALKIFITGDICFFGLASLTYLGALRLGETAVQGILLKIILNWTIRIISCNIVIT